MDPVTVKFVQLIGAEIFGAILALFGIFLFFRGITGKSDFVLEGKGLKAKLTNSAPGTVICLIGVGLIAFSLHSSSVIREQSTLPVERVLDVWLANSYRVTEPMNTEQVIDTIVGRGENVRFTNNEITLSLPMTLGQIAQKELASTKYWHILAAINKDRHYYTFSSAAEDTQIQKGALVQVWAVSKYNGMDERTRIQVTAVDRARGYDELLALARSDRPFAETFSEESFRHFHREELDLSLEQISPGNVRNLRELSLKLYGDPKYWPIIVWANRDTLPKGAGEDTPVTTDQLFSVPRFMGWPR